MFAYCFLRFLSSILTNRLLHAYVPEIILPSHENILSEHRKAPTAYKYNVCCKAQIRLFFDKWVIFT